MRCGEDDLAVHLQNQILLRITSHHYINLALLMKGSIELEELCSDGTLHLNDKKGISELDQKHLNAQSVILINGLMHL